MAQITLHAPSNDYMLPNSGEFSIESGDHFKFFVDSINLMFNDIYAAIGGSPTKHVTLKGPAYHSYLPNQRDFTPEHGDSFKKIVAQINAMFTEVYSIEAGSTLSQVTLRGPSTDYDLPNQREPSVEKGDSFRKIVTQINAMMTECYANSGGGVSAFLAANMSSTSSEWFFIL